jgi:hypothetical protein
MAPNIPIQCLPWMPPPPKHVIRDAVCRECCVVSRSSKIELLCGKMAILCGKLAILCGKLAILCSKLPKIGFLGVQLTVHLVSVFNCVQHFRRTSMCELHYQITRDILVAMDIPVDAENAHISRLRHTRAQIKPAQRQPAHKHKSIQKPVQKQGYPAYIVPDPHILEVLLWYAPVGVEHVVDAILVGHLKLTKHNVVSEFRKIGIPVPKGFDLTLLNDPVYHFCQTVKRLPAWRLPGVDDCCFATTATANSMNDPAPYVACMLMGSKCRSWTKIGTGIKEGNRVVTGVGHVRLKNPGIIYNPMAVRDSDAPNSWISECKRLFNQSLKLMHTRKSRVVSLPRSIGGIVKIKNAGFNIGIGYGCMSHNWREHEDREEGLNPSDEQQEADQAAEDDWFSHFDTQFTQPSIERTLGTRLLPRSIQFKQRVGGKSMGTADISWGDHELWGQVLHVSQMAACLHTIEEGGDFLLKVRIFHASEIQFTVAALARHFTSVDLVPVPQHRACFVLVHYIGKKQLSEETLAVSTKYFLEQCADSTMETFNPPDCCRPTAEVLDKANEAAAAMEVYKDDTFHIFASAVRALKKDIKIKNAFTAARGRIQDVTDQISLTTQLRNAMQSNKAAHGEASRVWEAFMADIG